MDRKNLKKYARTQVRQSGTTALKISAVLVACLAGIELLSLLPNLLENWGNRGYNYISDGLSITSLLLTSTEIFSILLNIADMLLAAGGCFMILQLHDYADPYYSDLLAGFKLPGRVILLSILTALFTGLWSYAIGFIPACAVITLYSGGDANVIMGMMESIPAAVEYGILAVMSVAMFFVSYRYRFHTFILMDNQTMSASQALTRSKQITRHHRLQLFVLDLSLLPWYVLCLLPAAGAGVLYGLLGLSNPVILVVCIILCVASLALLIWKLPYILTVYAGAYRVLMAQWNAANGMPAGGSAAASEPQNQP